MLILNPPIVSFGDRLWTGVRTVAVERVATREVVEWSDDGRFPTFADVPEQRVDLRIVQELERDDASAPIPGEAGTLTFHTAPAAADAARRSVTAWCIVLGVKYDFTGVGPEGRAARHPTREIRLTAISTTGDTDPITVADLGLTEDGSGGLPDA